MVATAATASLFPISSPKPDSGAKNPGKHGGCLGNVDVRGIKSKSTFSNGLQVKTNAQAPAKVNGTRIGVMDGLKTDDNSTSSAPRTFINQLPDWSMLLAAITTIFLAAEKQWMMLDWKTKHPDMLVDLDPFGFGRIVEDGFVFRQNFSIRSYEIGADRTASVETLMNHLQETALNHVKNAGLLGDGFGSTPEMFKRNLFWAVTKMQVLVDRYPTWGDVVQVDTWVAASGKNCMRRDWLIRDCKTGEILTRASSNWVMMNKVTRRLSKIPDEVRTEIEQYFVDTPPVVDDDSIKLPKLDENTADHVRSGLTPKWSDLDVNQHVNNVKYVGWILEMEQTGNNQKEGGVHLDPIADQLAAIIAKLDSLIALKKDIAAIKEAWLERRTDAIKEEAEDENQDPVTDLGMEKIPCDVSMPRATPITTTQTESQSPLISDLEKKMLKVAVETDAQTSPEEEEHKNHGETKNAELEQKLFSRDAVLKSLCGYSHKDHTKIKMDKKPLDWSFQKAIKGWMDDKEDWPAKLTYINHTDFQIPNSNAQDSFWAAPKFGPEKTQVLTYRWVHEGGQPTIEWLIAWCANYIRFYLRSSRLSGQDVLIQTRFLYGWVLASDLLMGQSNY